MAGTLSSLGLGSSGALSADTIDKLKSNDEKLQIDPIKRKIDNTTQKTQAYSLINSLMTTFMASTDRLGGDLLYLDRTTSVSGDGANITAANGVYPQSFTIDVTTLATKNIQQSSQFTSLTDKIATGDSTVTVSIDGNDFDIPVTAATTIEDFKNSINTIAGEKATASILNVADGDFRLVVSSDETGSAQTVSFSDTGNLNVGLDFAQTEVQAAKDSSFKYNGINFTRASNTITDITLGVSITLAKEGASSTATISQDTEGIASELSAMTAAYNSLTKELTNTTTSDLDSGSVGIFNGESTIKSLAREINKLLLQTDNSGNSLMNYGFELKQDGSLTFDKNKFNTEFNKDPEALEKLFKYETSSSGNVTEGIFKKLDDFLDNQSKENGLFSSFGTNLTDQLSGLREEQTRSQKLLDTRYESMFLRFAAYDRIIGGLEQQFTSLSQQIQMAINAK